MSYPLVFSLIYGGEYNNAVVSIALNEVATISKGGDVDMKGPITIDLFVKTTNANCES